jgi:hypothetical protein
MLGKVPDMMRKQWEKVYQSALDSGKTASVAAQEAWGACENAGWKKDKEGNWVNKADFIQEFSMHVSKATNNHGTMVWSAVNSDTDWDLFEEKMTLNLYKKMLGYIKEEVPPPAPFKDFVCSDYWCGGMPYLSLSHYPDLNGSAVPGEPLELFIDGNQLKAKGILFDNKLGKEVWKSLKADEQKSLDSDRIRISIAFLDLAHKHGEDGTLFERKSLSSICKECMDNVGDKIYMDGYLVHLALTRVPVNPRTILLAERSMAKVTRKQDAESIVEDKSIIEEIDEKAKLEHKANILIEMANTEPIESKGKSGVTKPPLKDIEEVNEGNSNDQNNADDVTPATKIDTQGDNFDTVDESKMNKTNPKSAPRKKVKKALTEDEIIMLEDLVARAKTYSKAKQDDEEDKLDQGDDEVAEGETNPPEDKVSARKKAGKAQKSLVMESDLDIPVDALYNAVNSALVMDATFETKLQSIQPALTELGEAITKVVKGKSNVATPASNDNGFLLEQIASLTATVKSLSEKMEQKSQTTDLKSGFNRIPVPRSITPTLVAKSEAKDENPNSVRALSRRSVGIRE